MAKGKKSGKSHDAHDPDEELWRRVTAEVKPLRTRRKAKLASRPPALSEKPETPAPTPSSAIPTPAARRIPPAVRITFSPEPELAHGVAAGIDKRTLVRLRRGQIPVEGEIDLHGSTQDQAHRALEVFLARSQAAGRRCVIVITGKGLRADGTGGVLRNAVPRWMNEAPNRQRILAFSHATPADGGEGALYVLLRRTRQPGRDFKE